VKIGKKGIFVLEVTFRQNVMWQYLDNLDINNWEDSGINERQQIIFFVLLLLV
jgi:hypothetical protein